jgi:hypothetical protein
MSATSLLTIFATPKKFEGHIGVIQRNAIESWTRMRPQPEIILFGTDAGTAEIAAEFGLRHVPSVKCNEWGTPLVSDLFEQAEHLCQTKVLAYVNSDIILFDDFAQAIGRVAAAGHNFLMVGRRTDVDVKEPVDFRSDWAPAVREHARRDGVLQIARSIDYFAFSRGLYPAMPPLAIGRFWWDNWLLWKARAVGATVVDVSRAVKDFSGATPTPSTTPLTNSPLPEFNRTHGGCGSSSSGIALAHSAWRSWQSAP